MRHFYIAAQIEESGRYYAYALKVSENDNLISKLKVKRIVTANICTTKKQADIMVKSWNAENKLNDRSLFDSPNF